MSSPSNSFLAGQAQVVRYRIRDASEIAVVKIGRSTRVVRQAVDDWATARASMRSGGPTGSSVR